MQQQSGEPVDLTATMDTEAAYSSADLVVIATLTNVSPIRFVLK